MMNRIIAGNLLFLVFILGGCTTGDRYALLEQCGSEYEPTNFQSIKGGLPEHMKRVVLMPVHHDRVISPVWDYLDESFLGELGKVKRFEVVNLSRSRSNYLFNRDQWNSVETLPADFFLKLQREFAADGVLFVDVTHYKAYKPLSLGVRGKLVDLVDGKLLWAFDEVFDAGNSEVAAGMRGYYSRNRVGGYPLGYKEIAMNSPRRFAKYVANCVFFTIPPKKVQFP